jgi:hypothetical protein
MRIRDPDARSSTFARPSSLLRLTGPSPGEERVVIADVEQAVRDAARRWRVLEDREGLQTQRATR